MSETLTTAQPLSAVEGKRLVPHAQTPGTPVCLVLFGLRRHIPDEPTYFSLWSSWDGIIIDPHLTSIPEGPPLSADAHLARAVDEKPVYLVTNGMKYWITSPAIFDKYGFDWNLIRVVRSSELNAIPSGQDIG